MSEEVLQPYYVSIKCGLKCVNSNDVTIDIPSCVHSGVL